MSRDDDHDYDYMRYLHSFEQAAANMRPITAMLGSYMNSLVENGFSRSEALELVSRFQDKILTSAFDNNFKGKKEE